MVAAVGMALAYTLTNGFHDAANAIAVLVATRTARPGQAIVVAAVFNMLGPLVVGTAVAETIAGIVTVPEDHMIAVLGAGLTAAVVWNVLTWLKGLPSSSSHALVGGLVGAALFDGGPDAVNWGGLDGWKPVGVFGVLIALAVSPIVGFVVGFVGDRVARRVLRRATHRFDATVRGAEWVSSASLAFSHGANDAQKAMGLIAVLLVAGGHLASPTIPLWVKVVSGATLTVGTAMGGWSIVKTVGQRIFRIRPLEGSIAQSSSTVVVLGASLVGAPVSTTQVVSSSVVGIGAGRRRWRHVKWRIVRDMGVAWILTLPAAACLGVITVPLWRSVT